MTKVGRLFPPNDDAVLSSDFLVVLDFYRLSPFFVEEFGNQSQPTIIHPFSLFWSVE